MNEIQKVVALKYPSGCEAPFISCFCRAEVAKRALQIAKENKIPIFKDENLLNILEVQKIGDFIPEEVYSVVAEIFAFIQKIEGNN